MLQTMDLTVVMTPRKDGSSYDRALHSTNLNSFRNNAQFPHQSIHKNEKHTLENQTPFKQPKQIHHLGIGFAWRTIDSHIAYKCFTHYQILPTAISDSCLCFVFVYFFVVSLRKSLYMYWPCLAECPAPLDSIGQVKTINIDEF